MIYTSHFTGPRTAAKIQGANTDVEFDPSDPFARQVARTAAKIQGANTGRPFPWEPNPAYLVLLPEIAAMTQTADLQYQPPLPRWVRLALLGFGGFNTISL